MKTGVVNIVGLSIFRVLVLWWNVWTIQKLRVGDHEL